MKKQKTKIFLLGGHDLEMQEIRNLLENREHVTVFDKNLSWGSALSAYEHELTEFSDSEKYEIYGIELGEADFSKPIPVHYHRIDHHNDFAGKPAAIEQIAKILNIKLSEYQKLVAANDSGYIPAMEKSGASREQIDAIRRADRVAQGVTDDDERKAEESIAENLQRMGDLLVVKAETPRFSTITDRLFPYDKLLIYSDTELTYYGKGKNLLVEHFQQEIAEGKMYHGGGENGYWGIATNAFSKDEIIKIKNIMIQKFTHSYHIFYYLFKWENENSTFDLKEIEKIKSDNWKKVAGMPENETEQQDFYNEKNYFYPFIHKILYNETEMLMLHYERTEPQGKENVLYKIELQNKTYDLEVDAININLYATGVGMLIFYLKNRKDDQKSPDDILRINQYGRRIFPPFFDDKNTRYEIAKSINISGLNGDAGRYSENYKDYETKDSWQPAMFIKNLIADLSPKLENKPVVDDRMFVASWYKNDVLTEKFNNHSIDGFYKAYDEKNEFTDKDDDFWYKYLFVDGGSMTCQNAEMRKKLLEKHTYSRWQKLNTLYGISRYSFVMLVNSACPEHLTKSMQTIYARMIELVLVQRASTLIFSGRVVKINQLSGNNGKEINALYHDYIRFVNQVYFREVTAQEQGIELYKMLSEMLETREQVNDLDEDISKLHQFATLQQDQKRNKTGHILNVIAVIFLPMSLFFALLSANNDICAPGNLHKSIVGLGFSAVGFLIFYLINKLINK
ncbi:MAG: hypothetical protein LBS69_06540 [Prevotellaceae bacterium]|jgi:Mg2+ and Co2+ transporter CorA|nr:hypothetical protein [Prevotellaceae bacterium]